MKKQKTNTRIQISSKEMAKRPVRGKSLKIVHNTKIAGMDKDLLSKIDNILIEYQLNNDLIPTFDSTTNPKFVEDKFAEKNNESFDFETPKYNLNLNADNNQDNNMTNVNQPPKTGHIPKKLPKVRTKKRYKNKDGFLTGVGLIKESKKKYNNKFIAKNDEEINNLLKNIDSIEVDPNKSGSDIFDGSPEYKARMNQNKKDFEELIREIDGYKKDLHEEFDEIQYLIKFTNNTEKLINRHKNVINSIFKGAGLSKKDLQDKTDIFKDDIQNPLPEPIKKRNKSQGGKISKYLEVVNEIDNNEEKDEFDDDITDENYITSSVSEINSVFYKLKKINQIKDNLCNIQDDCLDYHNKLKDGLKRSESAKTFDKTQINDI